MDAAIDVFPMPGTPYQIAAVGRFWTWVDTSDSHFRLLCGLAVGTLGGSRLAVAFIFNLCW